MDNVEELRALRERAIQVARDLATAEILAACKEDGPDDYVAAKLYAKLMHLVSDEKGSRQLSSEVLVGAFVQVLRKATATERAARKMTALEPTASKQIRGEEGGQETSLEEPPALQPNTGKAAIVKATALEDTNGEASKLDPYTSERPAVGGAAREETMLARNTSERSAQEPATAEEFMQNSPAQELAGAEANRKPVLVCTTVPTPETLRATTAGTYSGVSKEFFSIAILEHPAIPGLMLTAEQRRYSKRLEYTVDGVPTLETVQQMPNRFRWKKPATRTPSRTESTFVPMNEALFRKKEDPPPTN